MSGEVGFLDASGADDDASRNFHRELDAELDEYAVRNGELPPTYDYDALVISGSPASVYWEADWIDDAKHWVHNAIDADIPTLGVCFGHQLLADVLGGTVEGRGAYELGYHRIEHASETMLFEGVPREFTAFVAHSDDVVSLPLGARKLAANEYTGIQAFRKDHVFGVQFHAEFDLETVHRVIDHREPTEQYTPEASETATEANYEVAQRTTRVFENFLEDALD
ncbi:MAG: type 1 glutamine amidotransferase [Halorientalis sp.]